MVGHKRQWLFLIFASIYSNFDYHIHIIYIAIPRVHVGYELAIIISYPTSACGIIVLFKTPTKYREFFPTFFVKTTDFRLVFNFEQTRKYSYHGSRGWYNGSYTMMVKPIRSLELHYPTIQFLINILYIRAVPVKSINRGYHMAVRRYEISIRVLKNISRVSAAKEWNIFSTREEKFRTPKRPCNILFII